MKNEYVGADYLIESTDKGLVISLNSDCPDAELFTWEELKDIVMPSKSEELAKLNLLLEEAKRGLHTAVRTTLFYDGENICTYCGTENNTHHMGICPHTAYNVIEQSLKEKEDK